MVKWDWSKFAPYFKRVWRQGEHVSIIGSTGTGKSFLALRIVALRENYVLLLTKGNDKTLDKFLASNDVEITETWPPSGFSDKVALWPRFRSVESFQQQHIVFKNAINGYRKGTRKIDGIYSEGGWTVLIDEVMYFREELHLDTELRMLWTQGRSNDISLVAGTQRPRDVPQLMLNQWTHLFVFQTTDSYELRRLAEIGGNIAELIKITVPSLGRHEFLYINRIPDNNGNVIAIRSKAQ